MTPYSLKSNFPDTKKFDQVKVLLSNKMMFYQPHGTDSKDLYYKSFMIMIYNYNDSGHYYITIAMIVIYDPSFSYDRKLQ